MIQKDWFKITQTIFLTILALILVLNFATNRSLFSLSGNLQNLPSDERFKVTGEGSVFITPDVAKIQIGISQQGPTVKLVQDAANTVINKLTDDLKKMEIKKEEIKTINYSIYPNYDYSQGRTKVANYSANITLEIKVKKLDLINQVIDTAMVAGANTITSLVFDVENREKAEDQARELAITDAKEKAEKLAAAAGIRLGRILSVQESLPPTPPIPFAGQAVVERETQTQVQPGQSEIKSQVTLTFEIK